MSSADRTNALAAVLDRAPLGIYLADTNLRIQEINAAALRAFGNIPGGVIGRDLDEVVHILWEKAYADEFLRILRHTLETGEPYVAKERAERRADLGRIQYYEWRVERVSLPGEGYGVACYFQEVGDRRRAEQSAQRLASIVESSDDAIVSKDLNGFVVSWNKGAERLFGYLSEEVIGRHITIIIPKDRQDEEPEILARIRRGERVDHFETVRQRKDGSFIDISLTISPVRDGTGRVIGASKIARDITQRKQAEATQRLLLNELNHRVKNTLASVQAIAQQTLRRTKNPAEFAARFSGRIQSLARVHALLTDGVWQGADLRELIRDQLLQGAVDETRLTARGPGVRLGPQMATHLALMLHELGTNSVKYGAFSAPEGNVSVTWSVADGALRLKWVERGGPPVTAPTARGFGTLLIEQSATGAGGEAEMICEAEGVTWDITLPLPQAPAGAGAPCTEEAQTRPFARPAESGALGGRKFLVVEDEPAIALELASSLEKAGADLVRHTGAENEALREIETWEFDGALLDANLHGRPVDRIASELTRRRVPFIFVTGYGRSGLPASFRNAPILPKPFSEQDLVSALAAVMAKPAEVVELKKS